jgi:hypothetical protein
MRFLAAAAVAFAIMMIDFETGLKLTDNLQGTPQSVFRVTAGQAEDGIQSTEHPVGAVNAVGPVETKTDGLSAISAAVPQVKAIEPAQELPKKNFCGALKEAAESSNIPIAFFARLLWQESRFRSSEVSSAGAQGVAQFMPGTAAEVGLDDPFDPFKALPASAKFLRKLHDEFGNLGLAAAAYNAGGGRIRKWLSGRATLPRETRDYVRIITGNAAENWREEYKIVSMQSELPREAPCEGVGGLSKVKEVAAIPVALASSISDMIRNAAREVPAEVRRVTVEKLEAVAKAKSRVVVLLTKNKMPRKQLASTRAARRMAASQSARGKNRLHTAEAKRLSRSRTKAAARSRQTNET